MSRVGDTEAERAILDERARRLAQPLDDDQARGQIVELLSFRRGRERFAFEAAAVLLVARLGTVVRVPGAPAAIAGATTHQGEVLVVVDLDRLLDIAPGPPPEGPRWLLVVGDGADLVAVIADEVYETRAQPVATLSYAAAGTLRRGVTREGVTLLDPSTLLSDPRLRPPARRR